MTPDPVLAADALPSPPPRGVGRAIGWVERGWMPDAAVRLGIRRLLAARRTEVGADDVVATAELTEAFVAAMHDAELAPLAHKANEQHYEVPAAFFDTVLGAHRKYSSGWWPEGVRGLDEAEAAALTATCERARLEDGQRILELGCGWGSLCLWIAERFPRSQVTALSNSGSQRAFIEATARERGLANLRVLTADFAAFDTEERFDRIVSVEMFEHLRNWPRAFAKVARWLVPGGHFFMHVFAHRGAPYEFAERDDSDWMTRHFFAGGMMPSDDLAQRCQDDLRLRRRWRWDGTHYQRTAEAWLRRMDAHRDQLLPLFESVYGAQAAVWWVRWRMFFMAVSELFGFDGGQQWFVSHYLFERRA